MQKIKIYLPILIGISIVFGIWLGTQFNFPKQSFALQNEEVKEQKLRQIIDFIDYEYVDDVNTDSLLDITITELLHKLDPHSSYISVSDVQSSSESLHGSFEGIGIEFTTVRDSLTVLRVIANGPSDKAGLKAGDRILTVNKDTIAGIPMMNSQYIKLLKGPAGSNVDVGIYRPTKQSSNQVTIKRGTIALPSVDLAFMLNDSVAMIKVNRFAEPTTDEFDEALESVIEKGATKLILDLRDNPGGLLYAANKMADQFLRKDELIVYTMNRQNERDDSKASKKGRFLSGKLIVLINENSASASEIVAGALQDNDRATILGRRSYGKGLVQEEIELKDGSRIRLTTSRYYTPTGRSIQRPYDSDYSAYRSESLERYHNGELFSADSIKVDTVREFKTPKGKLVYGGGGIVPDVFVPVDTGNYALYKYFSFAALDNYCFTYIDNHRSEFEDLALDEFLFSFEIEEDVFNTFIAERNLSENAKLNLENEKESLMLKMKAFFARNLFGASAYFRTLSKEDPMVIKSLEVLK
jgi:carboxyl-terminal processing protease